MGDQCGDRHPRSEGIAAAIAYLGRDRPQRSRSMTDRVLMLVDLVLVASVAALAVWVLR